MKTIAQLFLLVVTCTCEDWGGNTWSSQSSAKTGDPIIIAWDVEDEEVAAQITRWRLYRQSSEIGSETVDAQGDGPVREFRVTMPTGTSKTIRYTVRPMIGEEVGPGGGEIVVKRVQ